MDSFGIINAIQVQLRSYRRDMAQSGRTTKMLSTLRDGDTVICRNKGMAAILKKDALSRFGKNIKTISLKDSQDLYGNLHDLIHKKKHIARKEKPTNFIVSHEVIEVLLEQTLADIAKTIFYLEENKEDFYNNSLAVTYEP